MDTATTANGTATAAQAGPGPEVVDAVLKWPAADRLWLSRLLADSVREGFTSVGEAERRTRELIRSRAAELLSGKAVLLDIDDVLDDLEREFGREDEG